MNYLLYGVFSFFQVILTIDPYTTTRLLSMLLLLLRLLLRLLRLHAAAQDNNVM